MLDASHRAGGRVLEPVLDVLEIPSFSGEVPAHLLSVFFSVVTKVKNRQLLQARAEIDTLVCDNPALAKEAAYWCFRIDMELYSGCTTAAHGVLAEAFLQNPLPRELLVAKARSMNVEDISQSGVFSGDTQKNEDEDRDRDENKGFTCSPIYDKLRFLVMNSTSQDFAESVERAETSLHESQTAMYASYVGNPIPQPLCNITRDSPGRAGSSGQRGDEPPTDGATYLDDGTLHVSALT